MLVFGGVHKQYPPSSPISIASLTPSWFFSKKCWVKQFLKHLGFRKVVLMTLRIPRRLSLPLLCWCLRIALRCSGVLRNSCQASQANTCIKRIIDYQSQWATPCFWWNLQWWATVVRTTYYPVCVWHPIPMTSCDIISSCGENDSKSLRNCLKLFGDAGVNSDRFFFFRPLFPVNAGPGGWGWSSPHISNPHNRIKEFLTGYLKSVRFCTKHRSGQA